MWKDLNAIHFINSAFRTLYSDTPTTSAQVLSFEEITSSIEKISGLYFVQRIGGSGNFVQNKLRHGRGLKVNYA